MYCSRADAVAAGAEDRGAALDAVIGQAQERVDAFTGTRFERWTGAEVVSLDYGQRSVVLPAEASAVTQVRLLAPDQVIPASSYRVVGHLLRLAVGSGSDVLVAGAEPWRGGYANLYGNLDGRELEVTATFGPAETPGVVVRATALLAALLAPSKFAGQADEEGNAVGLPPLSTTTTATAGPVPEKVSPWGTDRGNAGRSEVTTGLAEVDRLLAPYRRTFAGRLKVG